MIFAYYDDLMTSDVMYRTCECLEAGSLDNQAECHPGTGICRCKEHVEGRNCDR